MSERLPKLQIGEKVRVMQTEKHEFSGLANKFGKVTELSPSLEVQRYARVLLNFDGRFHVFNVSELMQV